MLCIWSQQAAINNLASQWGLSIFLLRTVIHNVSLSRGFVQWQSSVDNTWSSTGRSEHSFLDAWERRSPTAGPLQPAPSQPSSILPTQLFSISKLK